MRVAGAPVVIVGLERDIERAVALVPRALTATATGLTTAIVVRHDIVFAVGGIVAGAYPGDG